MTSSNWKPTHGVCYDHGLRLTSPIIPKSGCTFLRHSLFKLDNENLLPSVDQTVYLKLGEYDFHDIDKIPNDYDCLVFMRDPLERLISGLAEVHFRNMYNTKVRGILNEDGSRSPDESHRIEESVWNFINDDNTKNLKGIFEYFTSHGSLDIHLESQTTIMDWQNLPNKFSNVTIMEVDKNLSRNLEHWMNKRGTPIDELPYINANSHFRNGHKSYLKGIFTLAVKDNRNNLLDDYKEYFKTDIDFYNSQKNNFYRGGEQ